MQKLPVTPVTLPAALKGRPNGGLSPQELAPCGIGSFQMQPAAARAMQALVKAAAAAGFKVRATGTYRSLEAQERLFRERYTTDKLEGRPTKTWKGQTWFQRPNVAMAAVPGTSNHGLGLAVDFAEERDGDPQVESVSPAFVAWLCENADDYGFSAEAQSEPWHWRFVAGDATPRALEGLNAPAGTQTAQPASARPTVARGASGEAVLLLQRLLEAAGFSPRGADGKFGKYTEGAVRRFQAAKGLTVDGVAGPLTWKALEA